MVLRYLQIMEWNGRRLKLDDLPLHPGLTASPAAPHPFVQVIPTAELLSSAEAAVARWEPVANHPNLVRPRGARGINRSSKGAENAVFEVLGLHTVLQACCGSRTMPTALSLPLPLLPMQVGLRDAFVSADWDGSPSLYFAHDYHPGAGGVLQAGFSSCCDCCCNPLRRGEIGGRCKVRAVDPHFLPGLAGAFSLEQAHIMPTQTPQVSPCCAAPQAVRC